MQHLRIGPTDRQLWIKHFAVKAPASHGLVIVGNGSGEVRSVDDDNHEEICSWLNSLGWDALVYDKYGCGESDGDWKEVTFDRLRDDLIILADHFRPSCSRIIILGNSESSLLGVEAAEKTQNIDALVLRVASHQDISDRLLMQLGTEKWEKWRQVLENADETGQKFVASHPVTYWKSRLGRRLTGDIIQKLHIPILALNGDKDAYTPAIAFYKIHEAIEKLQRENARAVVIEQVGHSLRYENEEWPSSIAADEIRSFLKALCLEQDRHLSKSSTANSP